MEEEVQEADVDPEEIEQEVRNKKGHAKATSNKRVHKKSNNN